MKIGIDVGASGAIAMFENGKLIAVHDMPTKTIEIDKRKKKRVDADALNELFDFHVEMATIERVAAMPNQGVSSMFAFGQAAGIVEGVIATVTNNVMYVRPQSWKKYFNLDKDKDASRLLAIQLWPEREAWFKRKTDDGRAEAALIGLWGIENEDKAIS